MPPSPAAPPLHDPRRRILPIATYSAYDWLHCQKSALILPSSILARRSRADGVATPAVAEAPLFSGRLLPPFCPPLPSRPGQGPVLSIYRHFSCLTDGQNSHRNTHGHRRCYKGENDVQLLSRQFRQCFLKFQILSAVSPPFNTSKVYAIFDFRRMAGYAFIYFLLHGQMPRLIVWCRRCISSNKQSIWRDMQGVVALLLFLARCIYDIRVGSAGRQDMTAKPPRHTARLLHESIIFAIPFRPGKFYAISHSARYAAR